MSNKQESANMLPLIAAAVGGILIGCSAIFVRASDIGPMTTGFYRILLALPLLYLWMRAESKVIKTPTNKELTAIGFGGLFFAVDIAIWNWSLDYTAIVNATLFNNTAAFFVPIIIWLLYKERPRATFMVAIVTGMIGCAMLAGDSFTISTKNVVGDIAALISGLTVAIYVVAIKKLRSSMDTGQLMFMTGVATAAAMLVFVLFFEESLWPLTSYDWFSVLSLSILVHVGGQGLLAYSMGRIPAGYVALIMLLAPVTSALLGWVIYSESLSLLKITGIGLIMASIIAVREKDHIKNN